MREDPTARIPRRFVSIRTKLATATVVIIAAIATAGFFVLRNHERHNLISAKESAARMTCALFTASVTAAISFEDTRDMQGWLNNLGRNEEVVDAAVYEVAPDAPSTVGRKLGSLARGRHSLPTPTDVPAETRTAFTDDVLIVESPIRDLEGNIIGVSDVAFSLARETNAIRVMERRVLGLFVGLAVAISIVLLSLVQFIIVRPLGKLGQATKRLERGEQAESRSMANDEVGALARSFDDMSSVIRAREGQINARNRDMRLVLDNVEEGFLTLDRSGAMSDERSAILEQWFGPGQGAFADYLTSIDPKAGGSFELGWEAIVDGFLPLEISLDQLPRGFTHNGRTFELRYRPIFETPIAGAAIDAEPVLATLLVVLSDVTAKVERDRAEVRQRELAAMFQRVLTDRSGFDEFLSEARLLVAAIVRYPPGDDSAVLRRHIHTLKGTAGIFGLERIPTLCHAMEGLDDGPTASDLGTLSAVFADVEEMARRFVGADHAETLSIRAIDYAQLVEAIDAGAGHDTLQTLVEVMRYEPVAARLARLAEQVHELARRRGQENVVVSRLPTTLRMPEKAWGAFWSTLTHVVRNFVGHGADSAEERRAIGKPPAVTLKLGAREVDGELEILVADDGKGIDWEAVGRKAAALGLPNATRADLEHALYADGLSTRDTATDLHGRGIGMGAVRAAVEALGGRIELASERGVGTEFRFLLPPPRRRAKPAVTRRETVRPRISSRAPASLPA
jgi:two-component system, chemotaxis family, sensor kinase CheA